MTALGPAQRAEGPSTHLAAPAGYLLQRLRTGEDSTMAHTATARGTSASHRTTGERAARGRLARWVPALVGLAVVVTAATGLGQEPLVGPRPAAGNETLPQPRPLTDIGPRTAVLGSAQTFGTSPIPTAYDIDLYKRYVSHLSDPAMSFEVIVGHTRVLHLREAPSRIQIGDTRIFDYTILQPPTELLLQGQSVGSTTMFMWFGDRNDPTNQKILAFQVNVLPDPDVKRRLEAVYKALQDEINRAFPDAYVCLTLVGDKLVVSGEVKDAIEANKILQILTRNYTGNAYQSASNPVLTNPAGAGAPNVNVNLGNPYFTGPLTGPGFIPGIPEGQLRPDLGNYILPGESNIVNLLRIPGEQQVMLKVTLASVNREAARQIGVNWSLTNKHGLNYLTVNNGVSNANILTSLDNGRVNLQIEALRTNNLARNLAEPSLTTLNGRPATFFSGIEFPVPVVTGATATGLQGTSFVPAGVSLFFVPVITDRDRIRLTVNATVSSTSANNGTTINGANVPGLNATTVQTEVEMREGQTFAIGGLVQTALSGSFQRIPLFGDLPLAGNFFRNSSTSATEEELVLLVTPQLVHPLEPNELPALPGSDYFEPGDLEFYLLGRLESARAYDYRSPVMNDINRMAAYRRCELLYFVGPHGHSDGR
jgi:pilus assembly protein CpaC